MKKDNSTMFDYGRFYKDRDKIVRVCGSAHPISGGEDVILFSYVDKYITSLGISSNFLYISRDSPMVLHIIR